MERPLRIGDIVKITTRTQETAAIITKIDHEGIHTSEYLIIPKEEKEREEKEVWQVYNYNTPHIVSFIAMKRFE